MPFVSFDAAPIAAGAGAALLAALVFTPAAAAGPNEDFQAVAADYIADGDVTACRFTRQQLQNTKGRIPPDVARYVPNFVSELNAEIRRWKTRGCNDPRLASMSLSSAVFRAAGSGRSFTARRKRPVGTKVSFRLSEASTVRFTVQRRTKKRRYVKVKGSFKLTAKAGKNSFKFRGRIRGRKLKRGRYRLNARATDATGNKSALKRRSFRIVK